MTTSVLVFPPYRAPAKQPFLYETAFTMGVASDGLFDADRCTRAAAARPSDRPAIGVRDVWFIGDLMGDLAMFVDLYHGAGSDAALELSGGIA